MFLDDAKESILYIASHITSITERKERHELRLVELGLTRRRRSILDSRVVAIVSHRSPSFYAVHTLSQSINNTHVSESVYLMLVLPCLERRLHVALRGRLSHGTPLALPGKYNPRSCADNQSRVQSHLACCL